MPTINKDRIRHKETPYKHDNKSAKYYGSKQWVNLRNYYIRRHPLCEECLKNGIVRAAQECHHIVPFLKGLNEKRRWELLTDEDNLMALCKECHINKHRDMPKKSQEISRNGRDF